MIGININIWRNRGSGRANIPGQLRGSSLIKVSAEGTLTNRYTLQGSSNISLTASGTLEVIDMVTNPTITAIQALNPVLYYDFRFPDDPILGQLMYQDDTATTPVTATTQSIGYIENLGSLSSAPLIQSGVTNRPIWIDSTDGAQGDGIDDILSHSLASSLTGTDASFAWSGTPDALSPTNGYLFGNSPASFRLNMNSDDRLTFTQGSLIDTANNEFIRGTTYTVFLTVGATDELFIDNVSVLTGDAGTGDITDSFNAFGKSTIANNFLGTVKTIIYFDRVLTSGERSTLQGLIS